MKPQHFEAIEKPTMQIEELSVGELKKVIGGDPGDPPPPPPPDDNDDGKEG